MDDFDHRRSIARRGRAVAVAAVTLALTVAVGSGDGATTPTAKRFGDFPPRFSRIVSARVFQTRIATVRKSNARRIGRSLATLQPTWVTGLIRYAKGQHPNPAEVHRWDEITRIVRTASPDAQFDVTLNATQYRNADELTRMMGRVRAELGNDGWLFDFFSNAFRKHPKMIEAAIADAHANGEWIGGNVFRVGLAPQLPDDADFAAVQDFGLRLNLGAVFRLAVRMPVVYHLNSDPGRAASGGCRFIKSLSTARRAALIRSRASEQAMYGFRVSYPALFPQCFRERPGHDRSILYSYNAFRDPPMARTIRSLLDEYAFG